MYATFAFAITMLGVFSIFENIKGNQKFSVLKYYMLLTIICFTTSNFLDFLNFSAGSLTGQGNFVIGWDYAWGGGSEYFRGNIATVSVYNSVLSSSDVTTNFNANKTRFGL
jgi:hypothetical protein